jgi:hypothetical protein
VRSGSPRLARFDSGAAPLLRLVLVAACALVFPTAASSASTHRYGVRVPLLDGQYADGQFYDRVTGRRFVPRGSTYLRRGLRDMGGGYLISHQATFDVGAYDAAEAESALSAMSAERYNVVKVFLDAACTIGCLGDPTTGALSQTYLRNVVDFVRRAKRHGLAVILVADEPPWATTWNREIGAPFDGFNTWYLTPRGVDGFSGFWMALARDLRALGAPIDAIFAYELGGETWFQPERTPLSLTRGVYTAANGRAYDLARAEDRARLLAEGLAHWTQRVRAAIRSVDPHALVTMGFIAPTAPYPWRFGDSRLALPLSALEQTSLDFLDLHAYPGWDLPLVQYLANFEHAWPSRKPLLLGELGAYQFAFPTVAEAAVGLQAVQRESCAHGFDGWLLWTWDTPTPVWPQMWNAVSEGGHLSRALGPRARPDPCA